MWLISCVVGFTVPWFKCVNHTGKTRISNPGVKTRLLNGWDCLECWPWPTFRYRLSILGHIIICSWVQACQNLNPGVWVTNSKVVVSKFYYQDKLISMYFKFEQLSFKKQNKKENSKKIMMQNMLEAKCLDPIFSTPGSPQLLRDSMKRFLYPALLILTKGYSTDTDCASQLQCLLYLAAIYIWLMRRGHRRKPHSTCQISCELLYHQPCWCCHRPRTSWGRSCWSPKVQTVRGGMLGGRSIVQTYATGLAKPWGKTKHIRNFGAH